MKLGQLIIAFIVGRAEVFGKRILNALVEVTSGGVHLIDSTTAKAHRCAAGGKGGLIYRRSAAPVAAERRKSMPSSIKPADLSHLK